MKLPEKHKQNLVEAHEECAEIIRRHGEVPEPLETAIVAEEHRWFWKPEKVGFILVGESHVYTNKDEVEVRIVPERLPKEVPEFIPLSFVKLVYCLGYGEPSILDRPERIENNPGTSQYDGLFRMCVGLLNKPAYASSLQQKAKLLIRFKERGFWLLDASCHACSFGRRDRLPTEIVDRIVPISWNKYVRPIIEETQTDRRRIWIIGKKLHDSLCNRDQFVSGLNWIYQPNAYFKKRDRYLEKKWREKYLLKTIDQYRSGSQGEEIDSTLGDIEVDAQPHDGSGMDSGRMVTEKQATFARFVEELKRKGVKGEEYREKVAQWGKEH